MSTRAIFTFIDGNEKHHVYKHSDGYPKGAAQALTAALAYAWQLPRFEADEFAAAFVAANKSYYINRELELLRKYHASKWTPEDFKDFARVREYAPKYSGGGIRLMASGSVYAVAPADIEWRYEVRAVGDALEVTAYTTNFWEVRSKANEKRVFKGSLATLALKAESLS